MQVAATSQERLMRACLDGDLSTVRWLIAAGAVDVNAQDNRELSGGNTPLIYAAAGRHKDILAELVNAGADVNGYNHYAGSAMTCAMQRGYADILRLLIGFCLNSSSQEVALVFANAANDNVPDDLSIEEANAMLAGRFTPLMCAAFFGHTRAVKKLIQLGANVDIKDAAGFTALMYACSEGHFDAASALIGAGADVNAQDKFGSEGCTALICAAKGGYADIVQKLIAAGADVNARDILCTPLEYAAKGGHTEAAKLLIKTDKEAAYSLLFKAIDWHEADIVKELIKAGIDVNARDKNGATPLCVAASGWNPKHTEIVMALIAAGADVNAPGRDGMTPLMRASVWGNTEIVKALIAAGADVNALNQEYSESDRRTWQLLRLIERGGKEKDSQGNDERKYGMSALMYAAKNGHLEAAEVLIAAHADVNIENEVGWTALMLALFYEHESLVRPLIAAGANANAKMVWGGYTVLYLACYKGFYNAAWLLIKAGADVNMRSADVMRDGGTTPLIAAVEKGNEATVRDLIEAGADVNAKNGNGNSPLAIAERLKLAQIAELLKSACASGQLSF